MSSQGPDDLRAVHAARRDLGPEYDDALLETFVDRAETQLRQRMAADDASARRPAVPVDSHAFQVTIGSNGVALIAGNMAWGLLSTIITFANRNNVVSDSPVAVVLVWALLGLVDTAYIATLIGRRADQRRR